jgi:hypothetical protein
MTTPGMQGEVSPESMGKTRLQLSKARPTRKSGEGHLKAKPNQAFQPGGTEERHTCDQNGEVSSSASGYQGRFLFHSS